MSPAPREPVGPPRRRVAGQRSRRSPETAPETSLATEPEAADASDPTSEKVELTKAVPREAVPREAGTTQHAAPTWWRRQGVLVVLAVVAVLAVAAAVTLFVLDRRTQSVADARLAATEAARAHAETILSYDHTTLDEDFAAALAVSTGSFAEEYATTSEGVVRDTATETEAVVEAESVSAGVVSATSDRVVVLVFVNQTTTSNRVDQPQTDLNRVRMTMVDTGSGWLVEGVDAL